MIAGFEIKDDVLVKYTGDETKVMIPDGVTVIAKNAFSKNKKITEVSMPDSVIKIGSCAFEECVKLKVVNFSKNIEIIEFYAFKGCNTLKEVHLPDTLKELGSGCFSGCEKLTSITCSSVNLEMGSNPFDAHEGNLPTEIADKDGFIILAGILYGYVGNSSKIVVPDGVTHIAHDVFYSPDGGKRKNAIEEVILPESVEYIGYCAFENCKKLKSIIMPANVEMGEHVFDGCDSLVDDNGFFVQNGVAYAYSGDGETVTIPEGTKIITARLFANGNNSNKDNANIHKVILPDGLEEIGAHAFDGCSLLEEVSIPESVHTIGAHAFDGCSSLKEVSIPKSVHTIGAEAFSNCEHLKTLNMPDTVENIGDGILIGCKGLADANGFVIANNTIQAFYGASRNIVVPEGIVAISDCAFDNTGIKRIKLPSTLRKLGSAFQGCDQLEEIIIPEGVTEIEPYTFNECRSLTKALLPSTIEKIGSSAFSECYKLSDINIPDKVSSIGDSAFSCCNLHTMIIPNGVRIIEAYTFDSCENLCELVLPAGLEEISKSAFSSCVSLQTVVIPSTVHTIYGSAFCYCRSLHDVTLLSTETEIVSGAFDNCPALKDKDGFTIINNTLYKYEGKGGDVVVPEGVTAIADDVFTEVRSIKRMGLRQITLPSTLRKIGNNVFEGCYEITDITIPDSVTSIGDNAFQYCKKLSSVLLSAELEEIGSSAFNGCISLEQICIPTKVTYIGKDAFRGCRVLKVIAVEEGNMTYSSMDGMLMNKSCDAIIFVPSGKGLVEYVVPSNVKTISSHAFIDCEALEKFVIPASVENVGDEAFPRNKWGKNTSLNDIEVDPKAGAGRIGTKVFDFSDWYVPIVYPKLPVTFVKDAKTQVSLAFGFCLNPEKYEGEYAELYRKYVSSHEKTLIRKARSLKLKGIEEYFAAAEENPADMYKPNLSIKNPSELDKVELLENAVQKGTLKDVTDVLETYKTFEMTARALGLAARYRGVDFVDVLIKHGASFKYKNESVLQRRYRMYQPTAQGTYRTEYYLMIVPEKLDLGVCEWGGTAYEYSALCGVTDMNISSDMKPLSLDKRIEVVKYLSGNKESGISLDEMLFWALTKDELDFADALIEMGVNLQETPPKYYTSWGVVPTYLDMVTSAPQSVYWNSYVKSIASLKETSVFPVLERFGRLASAAGKQLIVSLKMFDTVKWSDESLSYVIKNADMSRVNQKKALEMAVSKKLLGALEIMADSGWLSNANKREGLINFARKNKHKDALAWLMDFKNRTVDVAKEEAKEEAKMLKELTEDPNSVSALRKKWSYAKLKDGTLQITSYKGDEKDIEVPSVIGKASVSSIGKEALSTWKQHYGDSRKKIKTVILSNGITEIGDKAFKGCSGIEKIVLPESVKKIGYSAFEGCFCLKEIILPSRIKVGEDAFRDCDSLRNEDGLIILGDVLYDYYEKDREKTTLIIPNGIVKIAYGAISSDYSSNGPSNLEEIVLPDGLVEIGEDAFYHMNIKKINIPSSVKKIGKEAFRANYGLKSIELPEGIKSIGAAAFERTGITELRIPKSLKTIPSRAFYGCKLRDVYIPDTVEKFGDSVFGDKEGGMYEAEGIYVHTPKGSAAEEYMKDFVGIIVINDYTD